MGETFDVALYYSERRILTGSFQVTLSSAGRSLKKMMILYHAGIKNSKYNHRPYRLKPTPASHEGRPPLVKFILYVTRTDWSSRLLACYQATMRLTQNSVMSRLYALHLIVFLFDRPDPTVY